MERKVTEWGCMQALIDFDGWRKWKDYASSKTPQQEKDEKAAARAALKAQFAKRPSNAKAVKAGA
jgi:osomolarity two-component system response regulator SSK1